VCIGRRRHDGFRHKLKIVFVLTLICQRATTIDSSREQKEGSNYLTFLNFGLLGIKIRDTHITDGTWTHSFYVKLMNISDELMEKQAVGNESQFEKQCIDRECKQVMQLQKLVLSLTNVLRQSILHFVKHTNEVVTDVLSGQQLRSPLTQRKPRSPLEMVGNFQSWAFGLVTSAELSQVQELIGQVKASVDIAAEDARRTRDGLSTIVKLSNERFDKFHRILETEQKSIQQIFTSLQTERDFADAQANALISLMRELSQYTVLRDELEQLASGIDLLTNGLLSPKLMNVTQLQEVLDQANVQLQKRNAWLCFPTAAEVLTMRNFDVFRVGENLVIRLKMPFTRHPKLSIYRMKVFDQPVPGPQGFVTRLQNVPRYWVINRHHGLIGQIDELPIAPVIHSAQVSWQLPRTNSCMYAIVNDDVYAAKIDCQFSVKQKVIPQSITKLETGTYVVTNYTHLKTVCGPRQPSQTREHCDLCLVHLACHCSLRNDTSFLIKETEGCDVNLRPATILHSVNLPLLTTFYQTSNQTLSIQQLRTRDRLQKSDPLYLPIFGQNVTQNLAADESLSFSLAKLAANLQNDSTVYHGPAEPLLNELLTKITHMQSFDWFSYQTWLIIAPNIVSLILIVLYYRLNRKLGIITTTMTMKASTTVSAYELRAELKPSTTTPVNTLTWVNTVLTQIRQTDLLYVMIILVIMISAFIVICVLIKRLSSRRSYVYLEIRSAKSYVQLRLAKLSHFNRKSSIVIPREQLSVELANYYVYGVLTIKPRTMKMVNTLTNESKELGNYIVVPPWTTRQLLNIISTEYRVTPFIVHSHEHIFMQEQEAEENLV
jgi:hypothetical protein